MGSEVFIGNLEIKLENATFNLMGRSAACKIILVFWYANESWNKEKPLHCKQVKNTKKNSLLNEMNVSQIVRGKQMKCNGFT